MKVWVAFQIIVLGLFFTPSSWASKYVGTITRATGDVQVLTRPKSKPKGKGPWVKYDSMYYKVKKAKVGYKLKNSNVVQTFSNGKAMVVFGNGDHVNVGPGTSYQMSWDPKNEKNGTVLKLLYGNVRGVVSPKGPRQKMKIITKSAVAGVRGTDFSISAVGHKTEVSVLRGKVHIKPKHKKNAKHVEVSSGFTGHVVSKKKEDMTPKEKEVAKKEIALPEKEKEVVQHKTILKKITKEKLVTIQHISTHTETKPIETESLAEAEKISKELKALEQKAKTVVLEDIKTYHPEEYEKISNKKEEINLAEVNTTVVSKHFKTAPNEVKEKKLGEEDFEAIDDDIYNKYFKEHL